jgi:hypothetical protein
MTLSTRVLAAAALVGVASLAPATPAEAKAVVAASAVPLSRTLATARAARRAAQEGDSIEDDSPDCDYPTGTTCADACADATSEVSAAFAAATTTDDCVTFCGANCEEDTADEADDSVAGAAEGEVEEADEPSEVADAIAALVSAGAIDATADDDSGLEDAIEDAIESGNVSVTDTTNSGSGIDVNTFIEEEVGEQQIIDNVVVPSGGSTYEVTVRLELENVSFADGDVVLDGSGDETLLGVARTVLGLDDEYAACDQAGDAAAVDACRAAIDDSIAVKIVLVEPAAGRRRTQQTAGGVKAELDIVYAAPTAEAQSAAIAAADATPAEKVAAGLASLGISSTVVGVDASAAASAALGAAAVALVGALALVL